IFNTAALDSASATRNRKRRRCCGRLCCGFAARFLRFCQKDLLGGHCDSAAGRAFLYHGTKLRYFMKIPIVSLILLSPYLHAATLAGLWEFEDADDLGKATVGSALT